MPRPALAIAVAAALVLAAPADAHVIPAPAFLPAGETQTLELSVPNERDATMTSFVATVPAGIEIVEAEETAGWSASVDGQVATWSGGSLPAKLAETFGLRVKPTGKPGAVELVGIQRYADGEVRWPVALTIVPGSATEPERGGSGVVVMVIVAVGALVTGAVALLARRRR